MNTRAHTQYDPSIAVEIIRSLETKPGALLPMLHELQNRFGYIPEATVPMMAKALQTTRAEIHGVISFYHHFRTQQPGKHVVEICRAEACQARGARALEAHAKHALAMDYHDTSKDRTITLEPVYCLGNCACGPSIRVGDDVYARMDEKRFDRLIDQLKTDHVELV